MRRLKAKKPNRFGRKRRHDVGTKGGERRVANKLPDIGDVAA